MKPVVVTDLTMKRELQQGDATDMQVDGDEGVEHQKKRAKIQETSDTTDPADAGNEGVERTMPLPSALSAADIQKMANDLTKDKLESISMNVVALSKLIEDLTIVIAAWDKVKGWADVEGKKERDAMVGLHALAEDRLEKLNESAVQKQIWDYTNGNGVAKGKRKKANTMEYSEYFQHL
jgi:hypothetical protein